MRRRNFSRPKRKIDYVWEGNVGRIGTIQTPGVGANPISQELDMIVNYQTPISVTAPMSWDEPTIVRLVGQVTVQGATAGANNYIGAWGFRVGDGVQQVSVQIPFNDPVSSADASWMLWKPFWIYTTQGEVGSGRDVWRFDFDISSKRKLERKKRLYFAIATSNSSTPAVTLAYHIGYRVLLKVN